MDERTATHSIKRRRVTRACDECRRKKIKCDGRLPCTHCTVYSYNCTFDQPSNRRRNPPVGYLEKLEQKCEKYETLLRRFLPTAELEQEAENASNDSHERQGESSSSLSPAHSRSRSLDWRNSSLESMLGSSQRLNRDGKGNLDYRGNSSGTVFIHSVCGQLGLQDPAIPHQEDIYASKLTHDELDALPAIPEGRDGMEKGSSGRTKSSPESVHDVTEDIPLPAYDVAVELTGFCFDCACSIIQFVHRPSFYARLAHYYHETEHTIEDDNFLSVLYSSLAVGCLFLGPIRGSCGIEDPKLRAFQYFQASKSLCNPLDRASTGTLQTLLCQVLFLQSTSNMSTCWTYIGTALRCAQRMGLHKRYEEGFNPIELQLRCKMFYSIRNIEIFLHAILGLPRGMSEEDYDQRLPLEIDDEYISASGIAQQPANRLSSVASLNACSKLMTILASIVHSCYPLSSSKRRTVAVTFATVDSLYDRLTEWSTNLSPELQPTTAKLDVVGVDLFQQSRLLNYCYLHVHLILYRPYIHYLSIGETSAGENRLYGERARSAAISALKNTEEILITKPACFGHWFAIYSTFFSGMIVLYCMIEERPPQKDRAECLRYLEIAKQAMSMCARCSFAAENCHDILGTLAKRLPMQESIRSAASTTFDALHKMGVPKGEHASISQVLKAKLAQQHDASDSKLSSHSDSTTSQQYEVPEPNSNGDYSQNAQNYSLDTNSSMLQNYSFQEDPSQHLQAFYGHDFCNGGTNQMRLHTQDTYQPHLGQPTFQEYFSMLQQNSNPHRPDMFPALASDQQAFQMQQGLRPGSDSLDQWQYYGDHSGLGAPNVSHMPDDMLSSRYGLGEFEQDSFIQNMP